MRFRESSYYRILTQKLCKGLYFFFPIQKYSTEIPNYKLNPKGRMNKRGRDSDVQWRGEQQHELGDD